MMPIVDGLEVEFEGRVSVIRLNADEDGNGQLLNDYGLRGHPSFVVLDGNNRVIGSFVGLQTVEALRNAMPVLTAGE